MSVVISDDEAGIIRLIDGPGAAGSGARASSTLLPPVDDAEYHLQVLCDWRFAALMHFRDDASAAGRAADATGLIPHALVRLSHPKKCLAVGQGDAHPSRTASGSSPASARTSVRKDSMRWSIGRACGQPPNR
jgi:hypothetical protein